MPAVIIPTKVHLTAVEKEELVKLYSSPAYSMLKRILSSHCILEQVSFADARMYNTPGAFDKGKKHEEEAINLNWMLDKLDALEGKQEEWFTLTLEHRR